MTMVVVVYSIDKRTSVQKSKGNSTFYWKVKTNCWPEEAVVMFKSFLIKSEWNANISKVAQRQKDMEELNNQSTMVDDLLTSA